jgi:AAA domain
MRNDFEIVLSDRDQDALEKDGLNDAAPNFGHNKPNNWLGNKQTPLAKKQLSELLRVATVDNFQGEEAKVIIVSLVRSNMEKRVGFLRTTNRINVLLSRAQHGMYLIGNSDTYSNILMWENVIGMLQTSDSIGDALGLCCPRHKETPIQVSEPEDFPRFSPEGGCQQSCNWRLNNCGHMCQARCHSESMHKVFSCPQPCQRLHEPCNHACQKQTCGEDCGRCTVTLNDVQLPCNHSKDNIPCYLAQNPGAVFCEVLVQKPVPGCDHMVKVACSTKVTSDEYKCPTLCAATLACGHPCPGTCGQCNIKRGTEIDHTAHQKCRKICTKPFGTCNHLCSKRCHHEEDCGLCQSRCEVRCQHSRCAQRCSEPCAPCVEKCTWSCDHQGACTMPCSSPCNRLPCSQRCSKNLPCGHQCPGLCGETCPEQCCHECGMKSDQRVDLLEMKTFADIDVNETPIVVLGCGHFFTAETLDGVIGLHDVYVTDRSGEINGLANISGELAQKIPQCPDCKLPVRQYVTQRYNRVINKAVIDEMSKRFLVKGKTDLRDLESRVSKVEEELEKSRPSLKSGIKPSRLNHLIGVESSISRQINARYDVSYQLDSDIKTFLRNVAVSHQPAHKLYEATVRAAKEKTVDPLEDDFASLNLNDTIPPVELDRRVVLGGRMVQIKVASIVLEDKFSVQESLKSANIAESVKIPKGSPERLTVPFLLLCSKFIAECNTAMLPKLVVEASLHFARIVKIYQFSGIADKTEKEKVTQRVEEAQQLLKMAIDLCKLGFENAEKLQRAAEESLKLLQKEWYEEVTADELDAIKKAMLRSPGGIMSHSGHWYNCVNGHPVCINFFPFSLRCPLSFSDVNLVCHPHTDWK